MVISKEQIISNGFIELQVKFSGVIQRHKFIVKKEKTGFGEVIFLVVNANLPPAEMARLSKELDFPIKSINSTAFPPGKSAKDFQISKI
ncbi:MAG: hypothetical protein AABX38_08315 [Candidatus Micrarchaeota archaeon]